MRKVVIIFLGLLACVSLHAQEVRDVTFKSVGNTTEICFPLTHVTPRQYAWIEIYYSLDDGKNWQGPLKRIAGDVGRVEYGGKKRVVWDVFSELEKINGILAFEVRASIEEKEERGENILLYSLSETAPWGLVFARVCRWGWFVRLKTDVRSCRAYDYECNRSGIINRDFREMYYRVEDEERKSRFGVSGGIIYRFSYSFYFFVGGGYGQRRVQWRASFYKYVDDSKMQDLWLQCEPDSFSGVELDGGVIFRYRCLCLSAGMSGINGKFWELSGGLGIIF